MGRSNVPPHSKSPAQDLYDTIRRRYQQFEDHARDDQWPAIVCYTPAGETIRIAEVVLRKGTETLQFRGADRNNNACDLISQPQSAQVVVRLIPLTRDTDEPSRKPMGFRIVEEGE